MTLDSLFTPAAAQVLPSEVIDGITEAVVTPLSPDSRSTAVFALVHEIYASVEWVHAYDLEHEELASLRALVVAAQEHQQRMSSLHPATGHGTSAAA